MCARRICGCTLRSSKLVRLILVAFAVIVLAGGTATAIQDVLNAIVIAASVLVAAIVAFFAIQLHLSSRQAIQARRAARPRPVAAVTAPRPAPAVPASPQKAAQAPADGPGRHARGREGGPGGLVDSRAPDGGTRLSVPS
jgi:hypothetical protein